MSDETGPKGFEMPRVALPQPITTPPPIDADQSTYIPVTPTKYSRAMLRGYNIAHIIGLAAGCPTSDGHCVLETYNLMSERYLTILTHAFLMLFNDICRCPVSATYHTPIQVCLHLN